MMFAAAACSKKEMIKCQVCGNKPGHSKTYFGKCEDEIDKIDVGEEGTCDRNAKSCMKKITGKCTQSPIRYRVFIRSDICLATFICIYFYSLEDGTIYRGCSTHEIKRDVCSDKKETKWYKGYRGTVHTHVSLE